MNVLHRCLIGMAVAAVVASPVAAQTYRDARAAAAVAQQAIDSGEWDAAARGLNTARESCGISRSGRACRLLIDFNLGHLYQRRARSTAADRQAWLERSVSAYRRVLAERPDHAATMTNLALVLSGLGQVETLQSLVNHAIEVAPEEASSISLMVGALHASASRWRTAYDAYATAARLAPDDEAPRLKMVQAYGETASGQISDFWEALASWESDFPKAAREGYMAIVRHRYGDLRGEAEKALVRWVVLTSEQRLLSLASARDALAGMDFAPAREFLAYLDLLERDEPERFRDAGAVQSFVRNGPRRDTFLFWSAGEERRHALALAALAAGRNAVVDQRRKRAERQWILGLSHGPRLEEYVYGGLKEAVFAPLELVTELTWLEFRYPELDPDERKFQLFIRLLFEGKAEAYRANDLEAIQRHHTVLGEIYAAKGRWNSDWADNAVFQLSHALDIAERRRESEGLYQPLPGLKARLVDGYEKTGRREKAAVMAIDATQAYLDTDDLNRATAMLKRVPVVPAPEKVRAEALSKVIDLRQTIVAQQRSAQQGSTGGPDLTTNQVEARLADLRGLPGDFVARQRFKIDADLANLGSRAGAEAVARIRADAALSQAARISQLIGTADMLRVERLTALTGTAVRRPAVKPSEQPPARSPDFPDKPAGTGPIKPELKPDIRPDIQVPVRPLRPARTSPILQIRPAPGKPGAPAGAWQLNLPTVGQFYAGVRGARDAVQAARPDSRKWRVTFANDSAALSRSAIRVLGAVIGAATKSGPRSRVWVLGRSDPKGDPGHNLALSKRRAHAVADYLAKNGIARSRVVIQAMGEQAGDGGGRVVEISME